MPDKKKYITPQIFEVPLRQEQAVLTSCNTNWSNSTSGGNGKCTSGGCKNGGGTNNANPPS